MKKSPDELQDKLDVLFIKIAEQINPIFHKMGFTANGITTLSLFAGLGAIYTLYQGHIMTSILLYLLSYFFDCADGNYARTYNQVSKFGDMYDHCKDVIVFFGMVFVLYQRNKHKYTTRTWMLVVLMFGIIIYLSARHLGCEEIYFNIGKVENDSESLSPLMKLCKSPTLKELYENMKASSWFGMGTFTLFFVSIIYILEKTDWLR